MLKILGKVLKWAFIVGSVILVIALVTVIIVTTPEDKNKPAPKQAAEKDVALHDLNLRVPASWQVEIKDGIARAFGCTGSACGEVLVYGEDALRKVGWQWEKIVRGLTCQGNKREAPGAIKKQPQTAMIGDRGAYRASMERCGVSNTEIVEVWYTQIPQRLIVTPRGHGLPNLDERLKKAFWTA